jgi:TfoX/Sxy family transcriptional regulator of competence genes
MSAASKACQQLVTYLEAHSPAPLAHKKKGESQGKKERKKKTS